MKRLRSWTGWALRAGINISFSGFLAFFLRYTSADKKTKSTSQMGHVFLSFRKKLKTSSTCVQIQDPKHHIHVCSSKRRQSPANELRCPVAKFTQNTSQGVLWRSPHRLLRNAEVSKLGEQPLMFAVQTTSESTGCVLLLPPFERPKRKLHERRAEIKIRNGMGHVLVFLRSSLLKLKGLLGFR